MVLLQEIIVVATSSSPWMLGFLMEINISYSVGFHCTSANIKKHPETTINTQVVAGKFLTAKFLRPIVICGNSMHILYSVTFLSTI